MDTFSSSVGTGTSMDSTTTSTNGSNKLSNGSSSSHHHDDTKSASESNNQAKLWLIIWTCNNIGVTLLNKAAFAKVDFRYPYFLSAVHMAVNALGSQFVFWSLERRHNEVSDVNDKALPSTGGESWISKVFGNLQRKSLDSKGQRLMVAFSFIFSSNVAIGNVSLQHVSVNFNQVMRSLVPALTIVMGFALGKPTSVRRQLAVLPVMVGVAMSCFGDMSYTALGFGYTLLCIFLASAKVVASGELLTGSHKLHPFDLLGHMAPLAFVLCLFLSIVTGEVYTIAKRWPTELSPMVNLYPFAVVIMSGALSFLFNISSLQTNKLTSPLTLCIAGNVKQVLMIVIATVVFRTEISPLNEAGIGVVLMGSALYSYVSLMEQTAAARATAAATSVSFLATPVVAANTSTDEESGMGDDDKNNDENDHLLVGSNGGNHATAEMTKLITPPVTPRRVLRAASAPSVARATVVSSHSP